jgi:hypothetical protein
MPCPHGRHVLASGSHVTWHSLHVQEARLHTSVPTPNDVLHLRGAAESGLHAGDGQTPGTQLPAVSQVGGCRPAPHAQEVDSGFLASEHGHLPPFAQSGATQWPSLLTHVARSGALQQEIAGGSSFASHSHMSAGVVHTGFFHCPVVMSQTPRMSLPQQVTLGRRAGAH